MNGPGLYKAARRTLKIHETGASGDVLFALNKPECLCYECVDSECQLRIVGCPDAEDPCACEKIGLLTNSDCTTNTNCGGSGLPACGCCCIDSAADPTKTTRSSCEASQGTWMEGADCSAYPCPVGCCCLNGSPDPTKTTQYECAQQYGGTWKNTPCSQTKCGCCCLNGSPDTSKTTQSECQGSGGTWLASSNCNSGPCKGPCCCIDGYVTYANKTGITQAECEDCTTSPAQCREYFYADGATCPSGFNLTNVGYCEKWADVADCAQCQSTVEGSSVICYPASPSATCGTWHKECSATIKYHMNINYTRDYYYTCSEFNGVLVGVDGSGNFSTCQYHNHFEGDTCGPASVGGWSTLEECNAAWWSLVSGPAPDFMIGGCDWPPAPASWNGCVKTPTCTDSNDG